MSATVAPTSLATAGSGCSPPTTRRSKARRRQGRLTDEQAEDHPQRSIITRALGPEAEVDIDTLTFSARPGDVFLICSDGLTTMIQDERIAEVLESSRNLDEAAASLVAEANEAGGRDNITVVAFRLEEADDAEWRTTRP